MTTNASRTRGEDSSHWYYHDGRPCYELPKKDGKGMKSPTLADARKLSLVPSVTTILKALHKEALVNWLIEQSVLAVLTTPRLPNEPDDAFVQRVLHGERVQDQESTMARERGTEMHAALEAAFAGEPIDPEMWHWVGPAYEAISNRGKTVETESIVVGDGYAGKLDLAQATSSAVWLWDWKTSKKLPDPTKGAWQEHRLQLAAYAKAYSVSEPLPIRTGNVYISTTNQGEFCICEHDAWEPTYENGFAPLVRVWQWLNSYCP